MARVGGVLVTRSEACGNDMATIGGSVLGGAAVAGGRLASGEAAETAFTSTLRKRPSRPAHTGTSM